MAPGPLDGGHRRTLALGALALAVCAVFVAWLLRASVGDRSRPGTGTAPGDSGSIAATAPKELDTPDGAGEQRTHALLSAASAPASSPAEVHEELCRFRLLGLCVDDPSGRPIAGAEVLVGGDSLATSRDDGV